MPQGVDPLSLIASPITGAFQYAGAKKQADAAKKAAELQAAAAKEALDYTKGVHNAQVAAFQPYQNVSNQALSALPGAVRGTPLAGPPAPYTTQSAATRPMASPLSAMGQPAMQAPTAGAMVLLQAPDGTQKSVPAEQAPMYIARGAKRLG